MNPTTSHATSHQFSPSGSGPGLSTRSQTTHAVAASTTTAARAPARRGRRASTSAAGCRSCRASIATTRPLRSRRYACRCPAGMVPVSRPPPGKGRDATGPRRGHGPMCPGRAPADDGGTRQEESAMSARHRPRHIATAAATVALAALADRDGRCRRWTSRSRRSAPRRAGAAGRDVRAWPAGRRRPRDRAERRRHQRDPVPDAIPAGRRILGHRRGSPAG